MGFLIGTQCSGIISCLFGSIVMGLFAKANIKDEHRAQISSELNAMARFADLCTFSTVGLSCFLIQPSTPYDLEASLTRASGSIGVYFGLQTILFCCVARAVVLFLFIPMINQVKRARGFEEISLGTTVMIWHSQLRGGLTVLMAFMMDPVWLDNNPQHVSFKAIFIDATIVVVIGFCYLSGFTCPMMLNLCGVPMGVECVDGCLPYEGITYTSLNKLHALLFRVLVRRDTGESVKETSEDRAFLNKLRTREEEILEPVNG